MDFFTVDTVLRQTYYVYFIIYHQTREIVEFAITRNPCRQFVRQQLIEFEQTLNNVVYMIHDNAAQFNLDYLAYGIKEIRTSVEAPNMNAIAERFIGSVRREALDYFLLISEKQVLNILREYIDYYNSKRPHQGLDQNIPQGFAHRNTGKLEKSPFLAVYVITMKGERHDGWSFSPPRAPNLFCVTTNIQMIDLFKAFSGLYARPTVPDNHHNNLIFECIGFAVKTSD
jgi:hypothetical protein